jgi:tetratricopeptide (TPR) repeat protein
MAASEWNEKKFDKWQQLREKFRNAKRNKDYQSIINTVNEIIELDKNAKFIGIAIHIFEKEIGNAYLKINDTTSALEHFKKAVSEIKEEQAKQPGSWMKDIERLKAKIARLESKS